MPTKTLRSPAWLLSGFTRSVAGKLTLGGGRIVFDTHDGRRLLNAALADVSAVKFPWYYFGGGMKLRIGTKVYRISFARPGNLPEDFGENAHLTDIGGGRKSGAAWKLALADSIKTR
jgi:hypothetical protein